MRRGDQRSHWGYDRGYTHDPEGRTRDWPREAGPRRYGGDYWWIGEHELRRRGPVGGYDAAYQRLAEEWHPRFSPVGGMYSPVGGWYLTHRPPRPLRENVRFSDWTRWF
jgi:hypothetical protein